MAEGNGHLDELQQAEKLVAMSSAIVERIEAAKRLGLMYGGERDVYGALGWKKTLTYLDYEGKYQRQDVAGRIVDLPADATWREGFELKDTEDPEEDTPFITGWRELDNRLRLTAAMARLDRVAGIGEYAVMFIGIRGQDPVDPIRRARPQDLIHATIFKQPNADVTELDRDPLSERFGLPERYDLDTVERTTTGASTTSTIGTGGVRSGQKIRAHWSRCLHAAEGLDSTRVYGRPRLQRVYNLLDVLQLVVGSCGEAFWRGARPRFHADIDSEYFARASEAEIAQMREQLALMLHGLQDWIRTSGTDIHALTGQIGDPRPATEVALDLAAAATGIPKRILLGSERGELASSQDAQEWAHRVQERQRSYAEPVLVRPLIDRLVENGMVPPPTDGEYEVVWPDLTGPNAVQRAELIERITNAEARHANAKLVGGRALLRDNELREVLGYEPDEELDQPEPELEPELDPDEDADADSEADDDTDRDEDDEAAPDANIEAMRSALSIVQQIVHAAEDRVFNRRTFDRVLGAVLDMAQRVAVRLGVQNPSDLVQSRVQRFMLNYSGERIAGINETTRRQLAEQLFEGMGAGESKTQLATRVRRVFREISAGRAKSIALTESNRAANFGALEGMVQAGVTLKRWSTMRDTAVRPLHVAMEGQTVPIGEPFVSPDGEKAMFPGEFASAAMSAGCRCWPSPGDAELAGLSVAAADVELPERRKIHERRVLAGVRAALREQRVAVLAALDQEL